MLARGLIISGRFVQVRTSSMHRSTHISNYQSSERESNQHDESDEMKYQCALKNTLLIIRDRVGLSFATKGLGYLAALYLPLPLLVRYKLSCYQTTCYRQFECLQKLPYLLKVLWLIPYTCGSSRLFSSAVAGEWSAFGRWNLVRKNCWGTW